MIYKILTKTNNLEFLSKKSNHLKSKSTSKKWFKKQ